MIVPLMAIKSAPHSLDGCMRHLKRGYMPHPAGNSAVSAAADGWGHIWLYKWLYNRTIPFPAPIRSAPASTSSFANSGVRIPPLAFTWSLSPTVLRMSLMSWIVAPPTAGRPLPFPRLSEGMSQ